MPYSLFYFPLILPRRVSVLPKTPCQKKACHVVKSSGHSSVLFYQTYFYHSFTELNVFKSLSGVLGFFLSPVVLSYFLLLALFSDP